MAPLASCSGAVLVSDSLGGKIWRVDTVHETAEVVFEVPSLALENSTFGVNGLKIFDGYLYYASTATRLIWRVAVSEDGTRFGNQAVVAQLSNSTEQFDDFSIDSQGVIYAAVHPNGVERIWPDGRQDVLVGGNDTLLQWTTSTAIAKSGHDLFVATGGVPNIFESDFMGRLVQVQI